MSIRKDANIRKLAIMALKKKGCDISELSIDEIRDLKLPTVIVDSLVAIKTDMPEFTIEKAKSDCDAIRHQVDVAPVAIPHYDPRAEIAEIIEPYIEPKEVVESKEVVVEVTNYPESELRDEFAKHESITNANTLLKKVLETLDTSLVDQAMAVKLSKEYAAKNKAAK